MNKNKSTISENAIKILDKMITENSIAGHSIRAGDIHLSLKMNEEDFYAADSYLLQQKYISGTMGGLDGSRWLTGNGIEFYERSKISTPQIQIGAIFQGPVEGSQIQSIANAMNSTVEQVVEKTSPEELRQQVNTIVEEMVNSIKSELNQDELSSYVKLAKNFQEEIKKENPDKSVLRHFLSGMTFLGDIEGAISFGDRALKLAEHILPYLPILIAYLNKIH